MSKFESFPQRSTPENTIESREQVRDRVLESARRVQNNEMQELQSKASVYENLKTLGLTVAAPGALYMTAKFLGIDIEGITGVNVSENTDALIGLSWGIATLGGSVAGVAQMYCEKKLDNLKSRLGLVK